MTATDPEVVALEVAEEPETWARAGFSVDRDGTTRIGGVRLDLVGSTAGLAVVAWSLRHLPDAASTDLDGFATRADERPPAEPDAHANGAVRVDHLVLLTDDLDRTIAAAAEVGLLPRRRRDHRLAGQPPAVQAFFRVGEVILEVVGPREPPPEPRPGVRSFGLALSVTDLDAAATLLGPGLSPARPAVQAGRSIATVRHRALGLRTPLALMTPHPSPPPASGAVPTES